MLEGPAGKERRSGNPAVPPDSERTPDVRVTGRRAAACLLDTLLALLFALVAFVPLLFLPRSLLLVLVLALFYVLLWCAFYLAYVALLDGYLGHTLGKALFGIRVIGEQDGRPPGPWRAALRASTFLFVDMFIGVFVMLGSPRRQRLGDLAANTLVVREEKV